MTDFQLWIRCPRPNAAARMRLFCFPFAGGGASVYRQWAACAPDALEVCPVQLPGREERYAETRLKDARLIAREAARHIATSSGKPYALFGQSMGTLVSFEAARILSASDRPPAALVVAAHHAPHILATKKRHLLSDSDLLDEVRRLGGTPEAVLENDELMELLLPIVRADLEVCDTYTYLPASPLKCPILAYGGTGDRSVTLDDLDQWKEQTSAAFSLQMLPGGHFFPQQHQRKFLDDVAARLLRFSNGDTERPDPSLAHLDKENKESE